MSGAMSVDEAFLTLLRGPEDDPLHGCVFDGELRNPDGSRLSAVDVPKRYVLVHGNRGVVRPDRFTGPARRRRKTFWVHSVGLSKKQAEAVAERVIARVLNARLIVDGWQCDPVTHEASQPVQTDESVKPARFFGVDQFDLFTVPAPVVP